MEVTVELALTGRGRSQPVNIRNNWKTCHGMFEFRSQIGCLLQLLKPRIYFLAYVLESARRTSFLGKCLEFQMQTLPDPNSDRLLFVLFSKLDVDRISDQSFPLPDDVLASEIEVVIDHLLMNFDHWSTEEKSKSKTEALNYIAGTDRDELVTEIRRRFPKHLQPLGRRILAGLLFCIGYLIVILFSPFLFFFWLMDKIWKQRPLEENEYRPSRYQAICEMSDMISRMIWPDKHPPCYCCLAESAE